MAPPRRTMAGKRFQETQKNWVIPFFATTTTLIAIGCIIWGVFSFRPKSIECVTEENTYCREDIQSTLQDLKNIRFFSPGDALRVKEESLKRAYPDLSTVQLRRQWNGTIQTVASYSAPLMILELNGEKVLIRNNGHITSAPALDSAIDIELKATVSGQQLTEPWGKDEQKNLAQLADAFVHFNPRIRKISAQNPTKVVVYPEGNGPIYLRVDAASNISAQLSTLQAFFRSTTMETPYQELDVRFTHLIIKE